MPDKNILPFKPAFAHPGGKRRLLKHILPHIPEHRVYGEPFCGGCAVLLAKSPAHLEVINDADGDMVAFYRYVRFHKEALIGELRGYINARANFLDLLRNPGFTDLQRAARWYLLKVCSFGSQGQTWGRDRRDFHGWDADRLVPLIDQLAVRLERVTIECGDWEKVVEFYDAPDAFFFFDPPYVNCGDTAYAAFTAADMARVRRRLDKLKGQWLLTCDDSPECRKVFSGLPAQPMSIRYSLAKNGSAKDSGELLVFHPALAPSDLATLKFPQKGRRAVA